MTHKTLPVIYFVLSFILLLSCLQTLEPHYGNLSIQLTWESAGSGSSSRNTEGGSILTERAGKHYPSEDGSMQFMSAGIVKLQLHLQPGDLYFEYDFSDSVLEAEIDQGIYNITLTALDGDSTAVYCGKAYKILVKSFETTTITLEMEANFPWRG